MKIVQLEELRDQQRKYYGCRIQSFKDTNDFRAPNGTQENYKREYK